MHTEIEGIINWLEELVHEAVTNYSHLDSFKWFNEVVTNNEKLKAMNPTLLNWMKYSFTIDLIMGLCRLCDTTKGTKSLVKFLNNLKNNGDLLTRERHKNCYKNSNKLKNNPDVIFDEIAGKGAKSYSTKRIESDVQILKSKDIFKKILSYRNYCIAHLAKRRRETLPTYSELFEAYNILEGIIKKYYLMLKGVKYETLIPIKQGNWKEPFTIAWI